MSDLVISTSGLRKSYGPPGRRRVALDGPDLAVSAGGVHGFLGPNGSGKTTTLRLLLGLARPDSGGIELFGQPLPRHLGSALQRVGACVEEPEFSPGLSGRRNLTLLARAAGVPRRRVDEVLDLVSLGGSARQRFGTYSLGMRQRLGIAAALLRTPDLLLLDEPTNGLDPAGRQGIRTLVRRLAGQGATVLFSSHNLAEVQAVCDTVSIIDHGRLLRTGTVTGLLGEHVAQTRVGTADPDLAASVLTRAGYTTTRDGATLLVAGHEHPEQITELLAGSGQYVSELTAVRPDLEAYFLRLTREQAQRPESRSA